ncbi:MAG: hypothetical protein ACE5JT_03240 [Nitrosopumilaceae archaeon]
MQNETSNKHHRLGINVIIAATLFSIAYFGITYQTHFVIFFTEFVLVGLSAWFILSMKKEGLGPCLISTLGCAILILTVVVPTDIPITEETLDPTSFSTATVSEQIAYLEHTREFLKQSGLYVGLLNISIALLLAYRPTMLYAKNRVPFEYPYPVWDSKKNSATKFSSPVVKVRSLLTEKEKWIIFRYKFLLVSIDNTPYLVKPNDYVPEDAILLRSKSGNTLFGI